MLTNTKIIALDDVPQWRQKLRDNKRRLVVTNGVFDLLHRGHAQYLSEAAACGDALLVCINDDAGVRQLKGATRPINSADDRACLLAALEKVSAVTIFPGCRATEALRLAQPDVYVKGGDYTEETLDREEYAILKASGSEIRFIPFVGTFSSTGLLKSLQADASTDQLPAELSFLFARRSIRQFEPIPVPESAIRKLLLAGAAAPSACAKDPWHFIVLSTPETRTAVAECLPNGRFLADAGLGLVVCGDLNQVHDQQLSYLLQDCAAAIENILLAAPALRLGACWLGIHPRSDRMEQISRVLGLPKHIIPVSALAIGFPLHSQPPRSRLNPDTVHRDTW